MSKTKTALVLGGGVGGLVTAHELRKRLPEPHRVVVVDREADHVFQPALLRIMTGDRRPEAVRRPLERLRRRGIEVIRGEVEAIDPDGRTVTVSGVQHAGDAIVVSLGAELAPEKVPGLAEAGHDFYAPSGAVTLRDAFTRFRTGRLVVLTAAPGYKCPAAPYEAAMLLEHACRRRGIRSAVEVELHAAEPGPMGVAGPEVSRAVREMVERKGIAYRPGRQIVSANAAARTLRFDDGAEVAFELLAFVPPHRAPSVVREAGLVGESGWVEVDAKTLATRFDGVYAIGDVTSIALKLGKPLPKAGVFAHAQAQVVARNLVHAWTGKAAPTTFDGHGGCFIETGDGKAGFGSGDFYAEPMPRVKLYAPARWWHWGKVLYEKRWLRKWL